MTPRLHIDLPLIPCAKKNNTVIRTARPKGQPAKRWVAPNKRVEQEEKLIAGLTRVEMSRAKAKAIPAANDVAMTVTIIHGKAKVQDRCEVTVQDLGPPPKRKRTGRRLDAINVPAIIADALNRIAYDDDRQITRLTVEVGFDE